MSGIFASKQQTVAQQSPALTAMPIQTSCYGKPVALAYGQCRIGNNIIDYQNFAQHGSNNGGGVGKGGVSGGGGGGGKGGSPNPSITYSADLDIALCQGTITGVPNMWVSQTQTTPSAQGFAIKFGTYPQTPAWGNYGYSGVAHLYETAYNLGDTGSCPNFNFEVQGTLWGTAANAIDADASQVVNDILTNSFYGVGFPSSRLGTIVQQQQVSYIPSSPYQITVPNSSGFLYNLDVISQLGVTMTCVASSPNTGQYSFNAGVYTFSAADSGTQVKINYAWLNSNLTLYQSFCGATGMFISPAYESQTQSSSMLDDLAKFTNSSWVWSSGVLTLVPRGTNAVSGNGYTYNPNQTPLFSLTDDDFLPAGGGASSGDDPVQLQRTRPADQMNNIQLEFMDRSNQYAPGMIEINDQAMIDKFGKRTAGSQTAHMFCLASAASVSAQFLMQEEYIRNTYTFETDERYILLDPMDLISITDTRLGITNQLVRITEITENDDGTLTFVAEEYPVNSGLPASYSLNQGSGFIPNFNVAPGSVNTPQIFACPPSLSQNQGLMIYAAVSGSVPTTYGGCYVYASSDGTTYKQVGKIVGSSRMGVTTADFAADGDPDTTDTLSVNLTMSAGVLLSGTQSDADNANTLCLVRGSNGDEYISYETATLTSAYNYNLGTYIRRAQYQTSNVLHPAGSSFVRIDAGVLGIPYQANQIGQNIYLKFTAFNTYGGGQESLSNVTAYPFTLPAPPPPPNVTGFTAAQSGNTVVLSWDPVAYPTVALAGYFVGYAPQGTTNWNSFTMLTEVSATTEITTADVPPGHWTFGIKAVSIAGSNDPFGNGTSAQQTTADLTVVFVVSSIVYQQDEAPGWNGTDSGFITHYTGVQVPNDQHTVSYYNWEWVDQYVPTPVTSATYTTNTIDLGYNSTLLVALLSNTALGAMQTGAAPTINVYLDSWLTGGSDPNTYTLWNTAASLNIRYFKARITYSGITAGNVSNILDFEPTVTQSAQTTQSASGVTVSPGGTAITFSPQFHLTPSIQVTPTSSGATGASATGCTNTGFTFHIWTGSTDTGGVGNWTATGI